MNAGRRCLLEMDKSQQAHASSNDFEIFPQSLSAPVDWRTQRALGGKAHYLHMSGDVAKFRWFRAVAGYIKAIPRQLAS